MKNLSKLYPLTVDLRLIFLNFNFFNQYESLRTAGKILIVISIILFFVKYFHLINREDKNKKLIKYFN